MRIFFILYCLVLPLLSDARGFGYKNPYAMAAGLIIAFAFILLLAYYQRMRRK